MAYSSVVEWLSASLSTDYIHAAEPGSIPDSRLPSDMVKRSTSDRKVAGLRLTGGK